MKRIYVLRRMVFILNLLKYNYTKKQNQSVINERIDLMNLNTQFWGEVFSTGVKNIWLFAKAEVKVIGIVILLLFLGFWGIGYEPGYAIAFAIGISLLDLIPVVGAGIAFIPWVIIEWIFGDPSQGWLLLFLYIGVEIIEQLIEPFFLGKDLELPFWLPAVIMILCAVIFNVLGIVVASVLIPFIAAYRQVRNKYRREGQLNNYYD